MSQIFNYINFYNILHIDDYSKPQLIHYFTNVTFRTHISSYHNFATPIGVTDNKIISLTNRQLSFLVQKYFHFLGNEYATDLKNTFNELLQTSWSNDTIAIDEEVFQFFDYDSLNGTGHSYDLLFHLLYHYKINNLSSKLLVVKTSNTYVNSILGVIKKYFDVDYVFIEPNKTYIFKKFCCTRSYQNVFFTNVKQFINTNLITPIIDKYEKMNTPYYDDIIKIKYENPDNINRLSSSFEKSEIFDKYCTRRNIFDLNTIDHDEELKIFIINKAKTIRINFGSIYFINVNYYLYNTTGKHISVIFHKNILPEMDQFTMNNNMYSQNTNYMKYLNIENNENNVYNNWNFEGETISNITNIDEYMLQTKI